MSSFHDIYNGPENKRGVCYRAFPTVKKEIEKKEKKKPLGTYEL